MRKIGVVVPEFYGKNRLFDMSDPVSNRDNCLIQWDALRTRALEAGFEVMTADMAPRQEFDYLIYCDIHGALPAPKEKGRAILLINESPLIVPLNWKPQAHSRFSKILTWDDRLPDGDKYFKINTYPVVVDRSPRDIPKLHKDRLCVMISGNKRRHGYGELYSERIRAIRWFERNAPEDFDLYGMGWEEFQPASRLGKKALSMVPGLKKVFRQRFPSYRGPTASKLITLGKYKFCICYENTRNYTGYITEKIFDCFWAGCVPVYWGAPNITDHIPAQCFIDRRKFQDYQDLYRYMKNMDATRYADYQNAIIAFLSSEGAARFSVEAFADAIMEHLV